MLIAPLIDFFASYNKYTSCKEERCIYYSLVIFLLLKIGNASQFFCICTIFFNLLFTEIKLNAIQHKKLNRRNDTDRYSEIFCTPVCEY